MERGLDLARTGEGEDALPAFTSAIELDGGKWTAFRYRGIANAKTGRHDAAICDSDQTIEKILRALNIFSNARR